MKGQTYRFKPSGFNTYLPVAPEKTVIFNTLTAQAVAMDSKDIPRLQAGNWEMIEESMLEILTAKGILHNCKADELTDFIDRVHRRKQDERWADITLVSSPTASCQAAEEKTLSAMKDFAETLKPAKSVKMIKGRFCGFSSRPMEDRFLLFAAMKRSLQTSNLPLITMWMSDHLIEILKTPPNVAASYFYSFDLQKQLLPSILVSKIFSRINQLVEKGKAVIIQFALDRIQDIEQQHKSLQTMVNLSSGIDQNYLKWGMRLKQTEIDLYYSPEDCTRLDIEREKIRIQCKRAFKALGFVMPIQLKLPQFHHDCPGAQTYSKTFDWRGSYYSCLNNDSTPDDSTRPSPNVIGVQAIRRKMEREKCRNCSVMPLCVAACPLNVNQEDCIELQSVFQEQLMAIAKEGSNTDSDLRSVN